MTRLIITFMLLILGFSFADDIETLAVVELPRPNSGEFTTKEAEARKLEILSNKPTSMLKAWKNPFNGFSIHVHRDDRISVYGSSGLMILTLEKGEVLERQSGADVKKLLKSIPLYGKPTGVLITSDQPLKESKIFRSLLESAFVPSIQLFYTTGSEQDGAGQPATAVDSKSEGSEKPKPESEGRSQ